MLNSEKAREKRIRAPKKKFPHRKLSFLISLLSTPKIPQVPFPNVFEHDPSILVLLLWERGTGGVSASSRIQQSQRWQKSKTSLPSDKKQPTFWRKGRSESRADLSSYFHSMNIPSPPSVPSPSFPIPSFHPFFLLHLSFLSSFLIASCFLPKSINWGSLRRNTR